MATPTRGGAASGSAYEAFLAKLQHPSAAPLLRSMKIFVRNALAATSLSVDELAEATGAFFQTMEETIASHPQWAGCELSEIEKANDGVEKFVMSRLHDRVFATDPGEAVEDKELTAWMRRLRFIKVEHLAIAPEFATMQPWTSAQQELNKIATYRTPRDKLVCILNCCKRINRALSQASAGGHGADEFFPVLVFITLQAAPENLHSSLLYISRFRHPSKLVSEAAYYLTHLQSACTFLRTLQPEQLSIHPDDFKRGLAETHARLDVPQAPEEREQGQQSVDEQPRAAALQEPARATAVPHIPDTDASSYASPDRPAQRLAEATPQLDPLTPSTPAPRQRGGEARRPMHTKHQVPQGLAASVSLQPAASASQVAVRLKLHPERLSSVRRRQVINDLGPPPGLRFLATRSMFELSMGDVADLLEEYKWLSRAVPLVIGHEA